MLSWLSSISSSPPPSLSPHTGNHNCCDHHHHCHYSHHHYHCHNHCHHQSPYLERPLTKIHDVYCFINSNCTIFRACDLNKDKQCRNWHDSDGSISWQDGSMIIFLPTVIQDDVGQTWHLLPMYDYQQVTLFSPKNKIHSHINFHVSIHFFVPWFI